MITKIHFLTEGLYFQSVFCSEASLLIEIADEMPAMKLLNPTGNQKTTTPIHLLVAIGNGYMNCKLHMNV